MTQQLRAQGDHLLGSVLLGRYRVVRELAKGGMGVVYLARAEGAVGFVKPVVVKLLLPEHAQDERFVGMFVREAKILSQIRHPSVVDVIEFGEQDGAYVLVMEYVRGYHLGQWLRYLSIKKRQPPAPILIQIMIDVLEALHHAHELKHPDGSSMQIVHRDVSPSNILLDEDGRARLLDFGVARMRGGSQDYKTQVLGFMGKMPYTAPELFMNSEASPKSDLYACGVVLHEALLGRNVFRAEAQAATLHKVMNHVPELVEPLLPGMPPGLDVALGRALMKAPADRHADAREFALALRRLQQAQESDIRRSLADLLQNDFGTELAEKLNIESLAHRDEAWRRLSIAPERHTLNIPRKSDKTQVTTSDGRAPVPSVPSAIGATVAKPPPKRPTPGYFAPPNLPEFTPSAPQTTAKFGRNLQPAAAEILRRASLGPEPPTAMVPEELLPASERSAANSNASAPRPAPPPPAKPRSVAPPPPPPQAVVRHSRGMMIAMCAACVLAVVAIALTLLRPAAPPQAPPAIRVVSTSNEPRQPAPPEEATLPPITTPPVIDDSPKPKTSEKTKASRGPDAQSLTQAMRRQQTKLEGCFKQHSVELEGQPTMQLEFDVETSGAIRRVGINPPALAKTALGECLLSVGQRTKFPEQPKPVSFAIPLTARRAP